MRGSVLDRAHKKLELAVQPRDASSGPRRQPFESCERLVQPAAQVLLQVLGRANVGVGGGERPCPPGSVEVERGDFALEEIRVARETIRYGASARESSTSR